MRVHALPLMIGTLCALALAYRFYSRFLAQRVLRLDDANPTPAHRLRDGKDFVPHSRLVLFGHHFAAITGAGPLIGPVLAAQFGFLPGLLWILIGVTLGGAVHDLTILCASVRHGGRSLAQIARAELSPAAGAIATLAIFFTVTIAIAAMGFAVVKILEGSPWATFTIAMTVPIALLMGVLMRGAGRIRAASVVGVGLLIAAVVLGRGVSLSPTLAPLFRFGPGALVLALCAYGFLASVLPVWLLLVPRDYLSSYMKLGCLTLIVLGILIINPELRLSPLTPFVYGGGPIVKGPVFPFVFITVACGAISGFHSLIASGTTPKMIDRESDCRPIGYGAMLVEGLVGVTSLIAAACLHPGDYFAINVPPKLFEKLGLSTVQLAEMGRLLGEDLRGRTGGSVSLAAGMTEIFGQIPGARGLLDYVYHFIVMFEALFILTTVDAGTRVARFLMQDLLARCAQVLRQDRMAARLSSHEYAPGVYLASALVVLLWGSFLYSGTIQTLWPLLGIANQLLATVALAVGTAYIARLHAGTPQRVPYLLCTLVPMVFVGVTTLTAGWRSIFENFIHLPSRAQAVVDTACTAILMISALLIIGQLCVRLLDGKNAVRRGSV